MVVLDNALSKDVTVTGGLLPVNSLSTGYISGNFVIVIPK